MRTTMIFAMTTLVLGGSFLAGCGGGGIATPMAEQRSQNASPSVTVEAPTPVPSDAVTPAETASQAETAEATTAENSEADTTRSNPPKSSVLQMNWPDSLDAGKSAVVSGVLEEYYTKKKFSGDVTMTMVDRNGNSVTSQKMLSGGDGSFRFQFIASGKKGDLRKIRVDFPGNFQYKGTYQLYSRDLR